MSTQQTWWQSLDVKQRLKLVVYALLLVNFVHYIGDDIEQAQHTFHSGWRWYDWTSNFATTLDELGWFVLLFLLELETYVLRKRISRTHTFKCTPTILIPEHA